MVEYKATEYKGLANYSPKNEVSQMDTRVKLYQPQRPIKDIPKVKTYDTKPPRNIQARRSARVETLNVLNIIMSNSFIIIQSCPRFHHIRNTHDVNILSGRFAVEQRT